MARKRMIDPSLWTDEGMAELTPRQQLLYIGLFSNADDEGRLKGSPVYIRLTLPTIYPGTPSDEITDDLNCVLRTMHKLSRYESGGALYLVFRNFRLWQKIDKPSPSHLPPPPADCPISGDQSPSPTRMLGDVSTKPPSQEKGIEENSREGKRDVPRGENGRRQPEDMAAFEPPLFAKLWGFYGKIGGCDQAAREWDKLSPDRALMQQIRQAIDDQRAAYGWGEPGGQAQPHLSTWLHGRRWEWEAVPNKVERAR